MARILLVEDDVATSHVIRDILLEEKFLVAHSYNGLEGLKFLGMKPQDGSSDDDNAWTFVNEWSKNPAEIVLPDLVIMDCLMPKMDGLSLTSQMAGDDRVKKIPVIVLTSKPKMEEPFRQLSNVASFITKPVDPDKLIGAVTSALAKAS